MKQLLVCRWNPSRHLCSSKHTSHKESKLSHHYLIVARHLCLCLYSRYERTVQSTATNSHSNPVLKPCWPNQKLYSQGQWHSSYFLSHPHIPIYLLFFSNLSHSLHQPFSQPVCFKDSHRPWLMRNQEMWQSESDKERQRNAERQGKKMGWVVMSYRTHIQF